MIYGTLFLTFFRIGIFSFGGGLAMLPLIFQTVQEFGFMNAEEFSNLVALSQVTPGPVAVNAATYVGFDFAGFGGAFFATLGVSLPSFVLVITVMKFLDKWNNSKGIEAAFTGIRPATVGLIGAAALFVGEAALFDENGIELIKNGIQGSSIDQIGQMLSLLAANIAHSIQLIPCGIFIVTLVLIAKFKMGPVKVILLMAIVGTFLCS